MKALVQGVRGVWDALSKPLQNGVGELARAYDDLLPHHREAGLNPQARKWLRGFDGNPRGFVAAVVLATPGVTQVSASAIERLYGDVVGRVAEHTNVVAVAGVVTALYGPLYGLRVGSTGARGVRVRPVPEVAPGPVLGGPWGTFASILHVLVEDGSEVRVSKVDSSYVAALPDGTVVRVEGVLHTG